MPYELPRWWFVLLVALLALAAVLIGDAFGGDPLRVPAPVCPPQC
jgi:hypothetical protein